MQGIRVEFFAKLLLLFVAYFVTARIGLSLDAVSGFAALVWPPTGIALAALLIFGYKYWPAIAAAAFLVNVVTGAPPFVAVGIAVGNTLEALLGAYLLRRLLDFKPSLERVKDVLGLIFFGALASTLVSATVGVTSLSLGGLVESSYGETWLAWWIGDMLGALVVAPAILVWATRRNYAIGKQQVFEAIIPVMLLIGASAFVFYGLPQLGIHPFTFAYAVFPFLIWIALRFRQRGCTAATFVVSLIAIWGTAVTTLAHGESLSHNLTLLQSFIGITAMTFMVMAAVVSEREQTLKKQHELVQRAQLLAKQQSRLEALNKAKDDFISIASHQLRTPATAVKQYLGMLLESYAGKLSKQQGSYAQVAYESNERQLHIINDLLRVANLDANKLKLEKTPWNISQLVADVVKQHQLAFEKRNQKLVLKLQKRRIAIVADKEAIRMVIENLVDNAGKYTGEGGTITVSVAQSDSGVLLQITDTGIGIAKKDHHKLFQKFSRVPNAQSGHINGSGLGLYWAKKVIDLHGGSITLTSKINEGSTFIIVLPPRAEPRNVRAIGTPSRTS